MLLLVSQHQLAGLPRQRDQACAFSVNDQRSQEHMSAPYLLLTCSCHAKATIQLLLTCTALKACNCVVIPKMQQGLYEQSQSFQHQFVQCR